MGKLNDPKCMCKKSTEPSIPVSELETWISNATQESEGQALGWFTDTQLEYIRSCIIEDWEIISAHQDHKGRWFYFARERILT